MALAKTLPGRSRFKAETLIDTTDDCVEFCTIGREAKMEVVEYSGRKLASWVAGEQFALLLDASLQ